MFRSGCNGRCCSTYGAACVAEALLVLAKGSASALKQCEAAGSEAMGWLTKLLQVGAALARCTWMCLLLLLAACWGHA